AILDSTVGAALAAPWATVSESAASAPRRIVRTMMNSPVGVRYCRPGKATDVPPKEPSKIARKAADGQTASHFGAARLVSARRGYGRKAKVAVAPRLASMRSRRLYLTTRSERQGAPVLSWLQ